MILRFLPLILTDTVAFQAILEYQGIVDEQKTVDGDNLYSNSPFLSKSESQWPLVIN